MSETQPQLEARDLHKRYVLGKRSVEVLRNVSFAAERGEFVALRGASGAGKSTLLHLLGGLDTADKGEIRFGAHKLTSMSGNALARWRNKAVGFIFQAYYLLPELDALENVCLPGKLARTSTSDLLARGRGLLERVGLKDRMDHRPYELSGGEQQRVSIARALINNPEVILADEPTGNLDSKTGSEIVDLLCELQRESQTTLIIATHDLNLAARAPRVVHLVDGQLAAGPTE
ncbi:MAG TPA: ABC transporter ATP-binding protein [Methylomirabilota bacterium]|nr:ABC transporter ATP-binding protein [Methylomirabilota bacterium]